MITHREKYYKYLSRNFFARQFSLKTVYRVLIVLTLLFVSNETHSQIRNRLKQLTSLYGMTAYTYFLSANRPSYSVDAYVTDKGRVSLSTGVSYGDDKIDLSVGMNLGIAKNLELSAGFSPYTESYSFIGDEIGGFGDSYAGLKYKFHESNYFMHALQVIVKIPTASSKKQLGTGKVDLDIGLAQSFFINRFGFDLGLEMNFLRRRDIPSGIRFPVFTPAVIDSINAVYDYKYEPEFVISAGPSYSITERIEAYAGFIFSRNMRLDYNTSVFYGGAGYALSQKAGIGLGASGDLLEGGYWIFSSYFYITL